MIGKIDQHNKTKTKPFWPSGRGWIYSLLLLTVCAATLVYTQQTMQNSEAQIGSALAASGSMRPPAMPKFSLEKCAIPIDEIRHGGPQKDGIPSLSNPAMIPASEAGYLEPADRVVGVEFNGEPRAYPLRILTYHEAVNDSIQETAFAVTYCPLCDSVTVFDRKDKNGGIIEIGISGLLYNSNVLLYDRQSDDGQESLWSQMQAESVAGVKTGQALSGLPYALTSWKEWKNAHPNTTVLSKETGHLRSYDGKVYERYFAEDGLMFSVSHVDNRMKLKSRVLGIKTNSQTIAFPIETIQQQGSIQYVINGTTCVITLSDLTGDASINPFPIDAYVVNSFWFAWAAFYPETDIYAE